MVKKAGLPPLKKAKEKAIELALEGKSVHYIANQPDVMRSDKLIYQWIAEWVDENLPGLRTMTRRNLMIESHKANNLDDKLRIASVAARFLKDTESSDKNTDLTPPPLGVNGEIIKKD